MARVFLTAVLALLLAACATVEGTGRQQVILTSAGMENAQGASAYREVLSQEKPSNDAAMQAVVERVGRRLAAVAPDRGFEWEFTLLESDQVNAWCLPGGKVAIYTGILPYCENEAGLAAVMGHEIAHAIARHGGERMSQGILVAGTGVALDVYMRERGVEPTDRAMWMGAFALGSQVGVMLPFSRSHELEADYLGLVYMAKAGYDPAEAPRFWQRFASLSSGTPEFLSTHPDSGRRSDALSAEQDRAAALYQQAPQQYGLGETFPARYRKATP
ncbi:MAG: M48 family metallopeptidase [Planctomycetota bacterium]|jgi:predicted Zn-dependent protease|nr:M48 family metallopeptidase [Planctomycetota bacterium]